MVLMALQKAPDLVTLNVNLLGALYFTRIAAVYLRQGQEDADDTESDKSIVLVSSIAGFTEAPGLPLYCASKHGILGLMRSLRTSLPATHNISVSAVCPWMTSTAMVDDLAGAWQRSGLPVNQAEDVAKAVAGLAALGGEVNGKSIYVEGGRAWDIEAGLDETRERWMGATQSRTWEEGQRFLRGNPGSPAYWVQESR
jgi:NAD(P)-dependent dehydrogenase (short-subunit alcohol dehydrogenase family)